MALVSLSQGDYVVQQGPFDASFNHTLVEQFLAAEALEDVKKTHYFQGRFENIYLQEQHAPSLVELKSDAKLRASRIIGAAVNKMGCWFNAMGPGAETTLHRHDDDDERLSGVYYVHVPERSGVLTMHAADVVYEHTPLEGQWVFFSPRTPHSVSKNLSRALRLSVAFNFS